jgi:hypothetical protein
MIPCLFETIDGAANELKRQLEYKSNQERSKNDIPEQKKNKTQAQVPVLWLFERKRKNFSFSFPLR